MDFSPLFLFKGYGEQLLAYIHQYEENGCGIVAMESGLSNVDAHWFYEILGVDGMLIKKTQREQKLHFLPYRGTDLEPALSEGSSSIQVVTFGPTDRS